MRQTVARLGWSAWVVMVGAGALLGGCGFTDLEMAAKQRQIDALVAQVNALKAHEGATCKGHEKLQSRVTSGAALSSR
jgi:formyltetrahydrofolate synthetase